MEHDTALPARTVGLRVLLLDDDPATATSVAQWLAAWGHELRVASMSAAAVDLARTHRPDVALLNLGMPRLSGYEVARRLRRQPESRNVVLVAMVSSSVPESRRRAAVSDFAHFLVKPVDPAQLETVLKTVRDRLGNAARPSRKSKETARMVLPRSLQRPASPG
jgi:two-component system CheB/CheR fusion protein